MSVHKPRKNEQPVAARLHSLSRMVKLNATVDYEQVFAGLPGEKNARITEQ
jgi:hypothetical protein